MNLSESFAVLPIKDIYNVNLRMIHKFVKKPSLK
jgi:hypothetical protein